jgi:predicted AlkP superfamily phosphohydrolase/phosphomutase
VRILVVGLSGATPELLFGDERLANVRRLMEYGGYGPLRSVIPPIAVPAWMSMATSQDPGSLGVYGFRTRVDYSYRDLSSVTSGSIQAWAIWDQVAREGKRATIIGVPPSYPPRKVSGICVGCFMTPDACNDAYTHPAAVREQITELVGEYPLDVKGFRTAHKDRLRDDVYAMSRKHFAVIRHFLRNSEWAYFQCVEMGLDRLQHGFWQFHDPQHARYEAGNPYQDVIRDYYLYLDYELGGILDVLDEDTAVLVVSDYGAQRCGGAFCVNEWLIREGLLVLNGYPKQVTPFSALSVNWEQTKVWSDGGYCAQVFFNVKGREPAGAIDRADYEKLREEIQARFEAIRDDGGRPMGTRVFRPEEIYRTVRNAPPDLIVHFGSASRRSICSIGYAAVHAGGSDRGSDTGLDGCIHSGVGGFILAAPGSPLRGQVDDADLLDIAPTLLELGGYDVPPSMQGRSLLAGSVPDPDAGAGFSRDDEAIIRQRLTGLGYIA